MMPEWIEVTPEMVAESNRRLTTTEIQQRANAYMDELIEQVGKALWRTLVEEEAK